MESKIRSLKMEVSILGLVDKGLRLINVNDHPLAPSEVSILGLVDKGLRL